MSPIGPSATSTYQPTVTPALPCAQHPPRTGHCSTDNERTSPPDADPNRHPNRAVSGPRRPTTTARSRPNRQPAPTDQHAGNNSDPKHAHVNERAAVTRPSRAHVTVVPCRAALATQLTPQRGKQKSLRAGSPAQVARPSATSGLALSSTILLANPNHSTNGDDSTHNDQQTHLTTPVQQSRYTTQSAVPRFYRHSDCLARLRARSGALSWGAARL